MDSLVTICDDIKQKLTSQEYLDLMKAVQGVYDTPAGDEAIRKEVVKFHDEFIKIAGGCYIDFPENLPIVVATYNKFVRKYHPSENEDAEDYDINADEYGERHSHRMYYDLYVSLDSTIEFRELIRDVTEHIYGCPELFAHRNEFLADLKKELKQDRWRRLSDPEVIERRLNSRRIAWMGKRLDQK